MERPKTLWFRYRFDFDDGRSEELLVELDRESLGLIGPLPDDPPEWTRLGFHQCSRCPLDPASHPRCPIAVRVVDLVETFRDGVSHQPVRVTVETEARTYSSRTSLQRGLSSLLGIYMATSGCPILDRLRPMVDQHLPFATLDETTSRMLGMYLLAQYFLARSGHRPDWSAEGLRALLDEVKSVNQSFARRLRGVCRADAGLNALVVLANFGANMTWRLETKELHRLERLYRRLFSADAPDDG